MTAELVKRAAGLTPAEIVDALDKHIVGQAKAKRAVAVALRNHYRRRQLPEDLQAEVTPKNIRLRKVHLDPQDRIRASKSARA